MNDRVCVIMAGGVGERFWPLSTPGRPKQLLKLTSPDKTMIHEAVERIAPVFKSDALYISASEALREPVLGAKLVDPTRVFTEPTRRNTLGAQCWVAANLIAAGRADVTIAVLTSDHMIGEPDRFRGSISAAMSAAEHYGGIVTIGILPTRAESGYGYIEEGDPDEMPSIGDRTALRARSFREKPSVETAEEFLAAGNFLWNSGMFFYTLPSFLDELLRWQPQAHEATLAIAEDLKDGRRTDATKRFESLPNISIDYAIMEHSDRIRVIRADFPWDDVGAWDAMDRTRQCDEKGNVIEGEVLVADSQNCIALCYHPKLRLGLLGLADMVVVAGEDAVLICHKRDAQRVRLLANQDAPDGRGNP
ncbi:MAG: sugar phosphate nucleotidyltransferase [Fimbriimonas sp.]|nr:sugar phosphate nucleotidyltransferase [Fimbriimonas sp.]